MLYALLCTDKPDSGALRAKIRADHLLYLGRLGSRVKFAGPFMGDHDRAIGSLVVIEAETFAQAEALAAGDPYNQAGLFGLVEIKAWRWTVNNPEEK